MSRCRCDRPDPEECARRTFVYSCGCSCHDKHRAVTSADIHDADDMRRFAMDRELEARRDHWNK